ncbi:hypothetical protein JQ557_24935 [Bradyrhizobium sp. U87765 SZCCT0131]|uniref:hypothetical protein n=1 Tax=unclassified Bradyrhizobium TaxID=2631580 RepID=UPI001BAA700F|nr:MULTISPECIES: hypothetical protein [unclassified Bradyrhizobium]MBR1221269.1 hypothetical protein [Bradyrhizobium sp. U87765 SZCCT0131]MBR1259910.1 hypothetical protein [Bradyrhizobium sp. U87765 SZCCT0134]MBR1307841.1 hypothetical protein [Bradyrhizobium sp. U87765 SZCCT0110]MBR1321795.1 hypothetical protein [Bradyrhizobium sp. U87765 SZCCT0109]MBR1350107.1 hypothetical protein [Bradyrhizobium sp. U87765 SZCCT0048]
MQAVTRRWRFWPRLFVFIVAGFLISSVITAVFAPWAFFLGGRFHWLPIWQGVGVLEAPGHGRFGLRVRLYPSPRGTKFGGTYVRGTAELCTLAGVTFALNLQGSTADAVGADMNGHTLSLDLANRPAWWWVDGRYETWRPRLALHGRWVNPQLVLDDGGTFVREFAADGMLRAQPGAAGVSAHGALHEGGSADFAALCRQL